MSTDGIDALLERYLHLLNQYTALRTELSTLQSSIYQDIARANFSAERGIRYSQDYYDSRLRASRLVQLTVSDEEPPIPRFTIETGPIKSTEAPETETPPQPPSQAELAPKAPPNPLQMFGVLVPPSLRSAQVSAVTMAEDVIPQLASTDAEMRALEIQIRRARKHHRRDLARKPRRGDMGALEAMTARDGPPPLGVVREGPAPPYVEVRFAEEGE